MTVSTSSRSKYPRDTCSPPDMPEPEKSSEKTVIADGNKCCRSSIAAMRHAALPCR